MSSSARVFKCCRVLMAAARTSGTANTGTKSSVSSANTGTKSSVATAAGGAPRATAKQPRTSNRSSGILKPSAISPSLRKFLGVSEISRADAVKKIWEYVKRNNLQNPENKKEIYCDENLKSIFDGKDTVGFLEIARLLSQHFVKID